MLITKRMDTKGDTRRYFFLRGSFEPSVLGNRTGLKQADIKRDGFQDSEEFDRLYSDLAKRRFQGDIGDPMPQFDVQYVEMYGKSNLTDFLQFAPGILSSDFMISDKVRRILSEHRLSSVSTFPARVKRQDGEFFSYWLLHVAYMPPAAVDFPRSSFFTGSELSGKRMLAFDSYEEMIQMIEEGANVKPEKIVLKPSFPETDLFALFNGKLVISEKLKLALEENKATSGVDLVPAFGDVGCRLEVTC